MNTVDVVHLLNEGALADDGSNEVESEWRAIVLVPRHHPPDSDPFSTHQASWWFVDSLSDILIADFRLNEVTEPFHGDRFIQFQIGVSEYLLRDFQDQIIWE